MRRAAGAVLGMLLLAQAAAAEFTQQGNKLVGRGPVGNAQQGKSVAISADGNTAIVGGWGDSGGVGAAWVFTRNGGVWSQQGDKLVGSGAAGAPSQGCAVAISADGETAIVGGFSDNDGIGAAWVFTRSGVVWSQQGAKLVGSDAVGTSQQGNSVAISADGNTAVVGGWGDNSTVGAAWVFVRSGGAWTQQGPKLLAADAVGAAQQGYSVAISADGNTAVVGGWGDNSGVGAAFVFTRSNGVWTQQGQKLVGTGAIGRASQGTSVALSADGNTALVGGWGDNFSFGAAWGFTRSGAVWSQQGPKIVGLDAVDPNNHIQFGSAVALSGGGNTAFIGGTHDNGYVGAAWVFVRTGGAWVQQGSKLVGTGAVGFAHQGISAALSADGATALSGGFTDSSAVGAVWVFARAGCAPPWISGQPKSQNIAPGQSAALSVTASGTAPLSYQWFQGASGDPSTPVGGDASTFTTPPLAATTEFWVRITNACGTAESVAATVSVGRVVRRHLRRVM